MDHSLKDKTVCVTGLGCVGLPLALAFSGHLKTIGFDVDAGARSPIKAVNQDALPTPAPMLIDDGGRR